MSRKRVAVELLADDVNSVPLSLCAWLKRGRGITSRANAVRFCRAKVICPRCDLSGRQIRIIKRKQSLSENIDEVEDSEAER